MPTYYKTVIKDSGVAGKGIFADEDIPKGPFGGVPTAISLQSNSQNPISPSRNK